MAGQVLVIVALCAVLAAAPCQADADAQLLYNLDGSPRLEIINTGVAGQSLQGRYSYQAPGGTLVWVQYPINHQGYVPWTPAEYTYSVGHNPAQNVNLPAIRPEAAIHSPGHNPAQNVNLPAIQPVQPQVRASRGSQRSVGHNPAQNVNLPARRPEAAVPLPGHNPPQSVTLPTIQPEAVVHSPVKSNF